MYQLTAYFGDTPVEYGQKPASNLTLMYVKPDWQTERWGFKPRPVAPDPGIFPISATPEEWPQTDFCWFPEKWQWFHCDLLAMKKYGKLLNELTASQRTTIITAFQGVTRTDRAYNNYNGTDKFNCYPCKKTNRGADPKWESLITCGNKVSILDERKALSGRNKGKTFVMIDSFKAGANPPVVTKELLLDPRVQYAKTVNPGRYLTNFTQLGAGVEVPVPILTKGTRWYLKSELERV